MDVIWNSKRTVAAALALGAAIGLTPGCRRTEEARTAQAPAAVPQAPVEPAGPPSPEVQAAVQGVIDSGRHPWLTWPEVPGALPYLEALYAAEPDGLFWFAGDRPHPALGGSIWRRSPAATRWASSPPTTTPGRWPRSGRP